MVAYVNFFWIGNKPNKKQFDQLQHWQENCQQTEFKVNLFVSKEIIVTLKSENKLIQGDQPNKYHLLPEDIMITDVDELMERYAEQYPNAIDLYKQFVQYKNYPFASDLARLIILNEYPGFYVDMDIKPNKQMPVSLEELKSSLESSKLPTDVIDFYTNLSYSKVKKTIAYENQILLTLQPNRLVKLLVEIDQNAKGFPKAYKEELKQYEAHKQLPRVKTLGNSLFNTDKDFQYLTAYKDKDTSKFIQLNMSEISEETPKGIYTVQRYRLLEDFYLSTISYIDKQFYDIYKKETKQAINLKYTSDYYTAYQNAIGIYFQSDQDDLQLYTWGNPGYSRLLKLQEAVQCVEKYRLSFFDNKDTHGIRKAEKSLIKLTALIDIYTELLSPTLANAPKNPTQDYLTALQTSIDDLRKKYITNTNGTTLSLSVL